MRALLFITLLAHWAIAQEPIPLRDWLVCGPFPFRRQLAQFFKDYLKEHGGERDIRPRAGMGHTSEGLGTVVWKGHEAKGDGLVDFVALYGDVVGKRPLYWRFRHGIAYAYTEILSPRPQKVLLLIGSEDWCAVWLNGRLIHESFVYRHLVPDRDIVPVRLQRGRNRLLIKVARIAGGWGFSVKVWRVTKKLFVKTQLYRRCPLDTDALVPEIREGEMVPVWGFVTVVNASEETLPFVRARVRDSEWFGATLEEIRALYPGEARQLPFLLVPKRPFRHGDGPRVNLVVETVGERQEFTLPVTVRDRDEPFITTHRSSLDGSVQRMTLLVPPGHDPKKPYPLVVALHGAKGCRIGHAIKVKGDFIIVAPHGRGQTGYRDFGERDVMEAMGEVKRRYRIDPERIYLMGHSMGGGGTFRLAVRYPHLWTAIVPMASGGARPLDWLQNLLHIPTRFYHGGRDEVVPVTLAREAGAKLKGLGYNALYIEVPRKPHWWGVDFPEVFDFFRRHRLVKAPRNIVFWTNDPRAHRAYWLSLGDFEDYRKPARIRARVEGARLLLTTENVTEVTVRFREAPEELRRIPLRVIWNGCEAQVTRWTTPMTLTLRLRPPLLGVLVGESVDEMGVLKAPRSPWRHWKWQRGGKVVGTTKETFSHWRKTPKRPGPVMDAFNAPFLVLYEAESPAAFRAARQFQHWWQNHALGIGSLHAFRGGLKSILQDAVSFGHRNLIVFLRARGERYGAVFLGREGIRIGHRRFPGKNVSVRFIAPHPFYPDRYLLVNAGVSETALEILRRVPMDLRRPYDFLVADENFLREGLKGLKAFGHFDPEWRAFVR